MKSLFILNGSTGNRGCEAILLSTYQLLREVDPTLEVINSSFSDLRCGNTDYLNLPGLIHRCHPQKGSPQFVAWQISKVLQKRAFNFERFIDWAEIVLSLGGDNYTSDYGSAAKYLDANDRVLATGKPLVIFGASVGPFEADSAVERRVAEQFRTVRAVVARERRTVSYLRSLGISDNVVLLPDPAFSLKPVPTHLPEKQEGLLAEGAIGLNLSPLLARYRNGLQSWIEDAATFVKTLLAAVDRPVILVPHVFEPGNDDQDFLTDVFHRVGAPKTRLDIIDGRLLSSMQLKYIIGRLHAFIGARTHATIAALSMGVPTLSIGYSVKAVGINEEIFGHGRWVVNHTQLNTEAFSGLLLDFLTEAASLRDHLRMKTLTYRMQTEDVSRVIYQRSR